MTIAILGTGLLGSGFARALRKKGQTVRAWNRTIGRARVLEADGIEVAASADAAVRGASRVHITVSDDAAVDAVLAAAAPGLTAGMFVIDHSTTSTAGAVRRTSEWRAKQIRYQHAPVFMGPQNALESTGLMLISGDAATIEELRPLLAPMTGKLVELGARVDAGAGYKLLGNLLLMAVSAGFHDMLVLAKAMQMAPVDIATLLGSFNPGVSLPQRFKRMTDGDYDHPSWELAMARKDARLMQDELAGAGFDFIMLPAFAALMDEAIARGDGNRDWNVIARGLV